MKLEDVHAIMKRMPRGRSFVLVDGLHVHTCRIRFAWNHPAFTNAEHCGKCWVINEVRASEGS